MSRLALVLTILGGGAALLLPVAPAQAQATRTWVSGVGDDANPCSRTAPCKTFPGAISKTAAGGEINCIDPGGFGGVTITKAITISCLHVEGGLLVSGTNGIIVNAGANDKVVIRGLDIHGVGTGLNGIRFLAGGELHVEKTVIRQFNAAGTNGFGISFQPSGASKLFVSDSTITMNGTGGTGGGILVKPTGTGGARGSIVRTEMNGNITALTADGSGTTGQSVVYVKESMLAGSPGSGLFVFTPGSGGGSTAVMLDTTAVVNSGTGVLSNGPKSAVFLSNNSVFGNSTGLSNVSSGVILSYSNNSINGGNSPTDGAPTGTLTRN